MKQKSVKKNYLYNLLYQVLILVLPIITTPYISRVLGAEKIGIYSYTTSIVAYFTLFGSLGVNLYGQREIAYAGENKDKRTKVFWEIVIFRFITMFISLCIYYITMVGLSEYQTYYNILIIYLIAVAFDISWLFQGMEEFKKTVSRNVIVRIISISLIFIFVKTPQDLEKYFLIYSLSDFVGNIVMWFYIPQYLNNIKVKNINLMKHIIPITVLFIPQIANKIYNIMDKTMLGAMLVNKAELGNYEEGYKVINVLYTIVSSIGIVMVPRIANIFSEGDKHKLNQNTIKSFRFVLFLAFPIMFGIISIAKEFVPFFLGNGFDRTVQIIYILSLFIPIAGITNVIGIQYLIPTKRQNKYTVSILVGLIVNLILNSLLINKYKANGAAFATVISQLVIAIVQMNYIKKNLEIKKAINMSYKYLISSTIMFVVCMLLNLFITNNIVLMVSKIIIGIITYVSILLILKDEFVYEIINTIKKYLK